MFIPEHLLNIVCNADNYIDGGIDKEVWKIPQEVYEDFFCDGFLDIPSGIFPELEDYFAETSPRFDLVLVLNKNKSGNIYTDELIASGILLGYSFECDTFFAEDRIGYEFSTTSGYVMEKLKIGDPSPTLIESSKNPELLKERMKIIHTLRSRQFEHFYELEAEDTEHFFELFPQYADVTFIDTDYYFDMRSCNIGMDLFGDIILFDAFRHTCQDNYSDKEYKDADMEIDF